MPHIHAAGLAGAEDPTAEVLRMSALNEEGVMSVRSAACDRLLASRVDLKLKVLLQLASPSAVADADLCSASAQLCMMKRQLTAVPDF